MGCLLAGHDSQIIVVWLRSSRGVNACMYIHIFSLNAERRPMKMKAMLIIIESRKQMRNTDDAKPRVHATSCCLHEACSVYMSICIQVFMYVCLPLYMGLRDSWLSSIALKSGTVQSEQHQFKVRERTCVYVQVRERSNLKSKQEIWKRANSTSLAVCSMLCVALYLVVRHTLGCCESARFVCMWYALAIMTILA